MSKLRGVGVTAAAVLVGSQLLVSAPFTASPAIADPGDGTITVTVIRDVNGNGTYDPPLEIPVAGIIVAAEDDAGASVSAVTDTAGVVTLDPATLTGGSYRVRATIPASMDYLTPAPTGTGLSPLVSYVNVSGGTPANLTMGVWNSYDYTGANPTLVTALQRNRSSASTDDRSLVSFPASNRGTTAPATLATNTVTGNVYGIAVQQGTGRIFSAAYGKRNTFYGPTPTGDPFANGYIYVTQGATTTRFAALPAGNTGHANDGKDAAYFALPGKISLGDIELSEDGTELYVVNMTDKLLYRLDAVGATAVVGPSWAIPDPGCPGGTDNWRPMGLGMRDGVLYVGGVCSAESSGLRADLRAVVWTFDPDTSTFGATPVVNQTLDFVRGPAWPGGNAAQTDVRTHWNAWESTYDPAAMQAFFSAGENRWVTAYPTPMLSDIAVETDGSLILGFRDRMGDQLGFYGISPNAGDNQLESVITGGDINKVCLIGGTYAWEGTGGCPNNHVAPNGGPGQAAEVVEYFPGEYYEKPTPPNEGNHNETNDGAIALIPSQARLASTTMDPFAQNNAGGVGYYDRSSGDMQTAAGFASPNGYQLFAEVPADGNVDSFGKANGLADLEVLGESAPNQIGNRVWFDTDQDGVQDPSEPPIPGVTVNLSGGGVTTTDANGLYTFGPLITNTAFTLTFDYSTADTSGLPGAPPASSLRSTSSNSTADDQIDSDPDSANVISGTTPGPGGVNHTLDAGAVVAGDTIPGRIFRDFNMDGCMSTDAAAATDVPVAGVVVNAYNDAGAVVATSTTDANGFYSLALPSGVIADAVRVQYEMPDGYQPGPVNSVGGCSTPSGPNPSYPSVPNTPINFGLVVPGDYCQSAPRLLVACNRTVDQDLNPVPGTTPALVSLAYTATGNNPAQTTQATTAQIGSTWGAATYRSGTTQYAFTSALFKRHAPLGPGGLGAIYITAIDGPPDATTFATIPNVGTNPRGPGVLYERDVAAFASVYEIGLGALLLSGDQSTLYSVNLNDKQVYAIPLTPPATPGGPPTAGTPVAIPLPVDLPGAAQGCAPADTRPFGLGQYLDRIYVSLTCTGPTTTDLRSYVYSMDTTGTFGTAPVLEYGLNYFRGCAIAVGEPTQCTGTALAARADGGPFASAAWNAWTDDFTELQNTPNDGRLNYPQPLAGDITFDGNGNITLSHLDRQGDQTGFRLFSTVGPDTTVYEGKNAGDVQRACGDPTAGWAIESNGSCEGVAGAGVGNGQGSGGGQYYVSSAPVLGIVQHEQAALGGSVQVPGFRDVVETYFDPFDEVNSSGYRKLNTTNGANVNQTELIVTTTNAGGPGGFGKANGLGDLAALCDQAPLEIGNYVWYDTDQDGVQDPTETPVPGVTVNLYAAAAPTTVVGTTTTSATGEYYFNNANVTGGLLPTTAYIVRIDNPANYTAGQPLDGYSPTIADAGDDMLDSDATLVGGFGQISLVTGPAGDVNHTYDFGFVPPLCAVGDYVWVDTNGDGVQGLPASEPPIAGATVDLYAPGATPGVDPPVATTTTDANGLYLFDQIACDEYFIVFTPPAGSGLTPTTPAQGGDPALDSNPDATGRTPNFTLDPATTPDLTIDAGYIPPPGDVIPGRIFRDYNMDGCMSTDPVAATDVPVAGVVVNAYNDAGAVVATSTTDANGFYSLALPSGVIADAVRVQYEMPDGYQPGPVNSVGGCSTPSGPNPSYPSVPNIPINFGLVVPGDYCQSAPNLATICQRGLNAAGSALVDGTSTTLYTLGADVTGTPAIGTGAGDLRPQATLAQTGNIWGMASYGSNFVWTAAMLKRHTPIGPGGLGAIYLTQTETGTPNATPWVTIPNVGTNPRPGSTATGSDDPILGSNDWFHDPSVWPVIGKVGLGDIDISADGSTLYAMNLNDKQLYAVPVIPPVTPGGAPTAGTPVAIPLPTALPGAAQACADQWLRPFAVEADGFGVWVGMTCTGPTQADLHSYIYRMDLATSTFDAAPAFEMELSGYNRGCAFFAANGGICDQAVWRVWDDVVHATSTGGQYIWAQPLLSDIEFDSNGDMTMGIMDRTGARIGDNAGGLDPADPATLAVGNASGDLLRACGTRATGWVLESNASCGSRTGTERVGNNGGPGGGSFYEDSYSDPGTGNRHDEKSLGATEQIPGFANVMFTVFDPFNGSNVREGGIQRDRNLDGNGINAVRVYGNAKNDGSTLSQGTFGKAGSMGDIEALCDMAPLEIGNYVWYDTDLDGVQDPTETPVPGVTVNLYDATNTVVATTTTSATGEYYFNNANVTGGLLPATAYTVRIDNPADYTAGAPLDGYAPTIADTPPDDILDSDATSVGGFGQISLTTGPAGDVNHTYDFGFIPAPELCAVGDYVWVDTNGDGIQGAAATEPPIPGATVALYAAGATPGVDPPVATTTTDINGLYLFDQIACDEYLIVFTPPAGSGLTPTPPAQGGDPALDSNPDATGTTPNFTLDPATTPDLTIDAGYIPPPPGLDKKVEGVDTLVTPLPVTIGSQVDYTITVTADPLYPASAVAVDDVLPTGVTYVSDDGAGAYVPATGVWTIGDMTPGQSVTLTITVTVNGPAAVVVTNGAELTINGGTPVPDDPPGSVPPSKNISTTDGIDEVDIVPQPEPVCSVGDFVWLDTNANGIQDAGEAGVEGVTVALFLADGTPAGTTVTDVNGAYAFAGLTCAEYFVTFTPPAGSGFTFTGQSTPGSTTANDSNPDPATGQTPNFTLAPLPGNQDDVTIDAGLIPPPPPALDKKVEGDDTLLTPLPVTIGSQVDYTVTVTADATSPALDVAVDDLLPTGVTYVSDDGAGAYVPATGVWTIGDMTPGQSVTLTITVTVTGPAGVVITNGAELTINGGTPVPDDPPGSIPPSKNTTTSDGVDEVDIIPQAVPLCSVGDYVWVDANGDGIQGAPADEPPIAGATVNLYAPGATPGVDPPVATTTTDASGLYVFDDITCGEYFIVFTPPAGSGLTPTAPAAPGSTPDNDSNPDATGRTPNFTLAPLPGNQDDVTIDAGYLPPPPALDKTVNGDDTLAAALPVDIGQNVTYTITVANTSAYPVANVTVTDVLPADVTYVSDDGAGAYAAAIWTIGTMLPNTTATLNIVVTVTGDPGVPINNTAQLEVNGDPVPDVPNPNQPFNPPGNDTPSDGTDIVIIVPNELCAVGDYVWLDLNGDGVQGLPAAEPSVAGALVELLNPDLTPALGTDGLPIAPVTTLADGLYAFTGVPCVPYVVRFTPPAGSGLTFTDPAQGGDPATDSNPDPGTGVTPPFTPVAGTPDNSIDAGLVPPPPALDKTVQGEDTLNAALPVNVGSQVDYTITVANTSAYPVANVVVIDPLPVGGVAYVSDSGPYDSGTSTWTIGTMAPGQTVSVTITVLVVGLPGLPISNTAQLFVNNEPVPDVPNPGQPFNPPGNDTPTDGTDTVIIVPQAVPVCSVGDFVWLDIDADGIQDAPGMGGEPPIPGAIVNLYAAGATPGVDPPVATDTTGVAGDYSFPGLACGEYFITFTPPAGSGLTPTTQSAPGSTTANDSNPNPAGQTPNFILAALTPTQDDVTVDAGFLSPPVCAVGDYVWLDLDEDGVQDAGEQSVAGVLVELLNPDLTPALGTDGLPIPPTTTAVGTGLYSFTGVPCVPYVVRFTPPATSGLTFTDPAQGGDALLDSNPDPATGVTPPFTPLPGTPDNSIDAGLVPPPPALDKTVNGDDTLAAGLPVTIGSNVTYTITVSNPSAFPLANVVVNDVLPGGVTYVSDDGAGTYVPGTGVWTIGTLVPGQSVTLNIVATVTGPAGAPVSNTAQLFVNGDPVPDVPNPNQPFNPPGNDTPTDGTDIVIIVPQAVPVCSVGDFVWLDSDGNGIQDAGELGIDGVVVSLFDAPGIMVDTETTAFGGLYSFPGLACDEYYVTFTPPAGSGLTPTTQSAPGSTPANDSNADPTGRTPNFTLAPLPGNQDDVTIDAGFVPPPPPALDKTVNGDDTISGPLTVTVGEDVVYLITVVNPAAVPVANVSVADLLPAGVAFTSAAPSQGTYAFDTGVWTIGTLAAGQTVTLSIIADVTAAPGTNVENRAVLSVNGTPVPDVPNGTQPDPTQNTDPTDGDDNVDITVVAVPVCTVGNYVWVDTNGDGVQGLPADEPPVADVLVELLNPDLTPVAGVPSQTTMVDGLYSFAGVPCQQYVVRFTASLGSGLTLTDPAQGGDPATDSNPDPATGVTSPFTPVTGTPENTIDAGFVPPPPGLDKFVAQGVDTLAAPFPVTIGQQYPYGITVTNPSAYPVVNVQVIDPLPAGATYVSDDGAGAYDPLTSVWTIGTMQPFTTVTLVITFTVTGQPGVLISNTAQLVVNGDAVPDVPDPNQPFNPTGNDTPTDGVDTVIIVPDPLCALGDMVWLDVNGNGIFEAGEIGVAGATVELLNPDLTPALGTNGLPIPSQTTLADGLYSFTDVPCVPYVVRFTPPAGSGLTPTTQSAPGSTTANDSNPDPATGVTPTFTPVAGQPDLTIDEGLVPPVVEPVCSVGDFVWIDADANGRQDAGEAGLAGVTVNIYAAGDTPGVDAPAGTAVTDAAGAYLVPGLDCGEYFAVFVPPAGYAPTPQSAPGTTTADDSNADATGTTPSFLLSVGDNPNDVTIDAGFVPPVVPPMCSVGSFVWIDGNTNGLQDPGEAGVPDVSVALYTPGQTPGVDAPVATVLTDANGEYMFSGIPCQDYFIVFTPPAGSGLSFTAQGGDPGSPADSNPDGSGRTAVFSLTPENPVNVTLDAGLVLVTCSVGDYVWLDNNRNNAQDPGETGIAGVTVVIYTAGSTPGVTPPVATTTTDANGMYAFAGLVCQEYFIVFSAPGGSSFTPTGQGGDPASPSDSNQDPSGRTPNFVLVPGGPSNLTIDAGFVPPLPPPLPPTATTTPPPPTVPGEDLPRTGSNTAELLRVALLALAAGGAILLLTRRRPRRRVL